MKKAAQYILLAFVFGAIGFWAWGKYTGSAEGSPETSASAEAVTQSAQPVVVVTYFTTNVRCDSCRTIETLTRASVQEQFEDEVNAGHLRFEKVNLDEPQNKHFAEDYKLAFKTVVVSEESSGEVLRWKKRDEVWSLMNEPDAFKTYIAEPVREFLNSQS